MPPGRKRGAPSPRNRPQTFWRVGSATFLRVGLLCGLVFLIAAFIRDRLSAANWAAPIEYKADAMQILAWIKAASELDYVPFASKIVPRLGAPYSANWNDYPMYEEIITFLLGLFARFFGLGQATNVGLFVTYIP